jgi:hypothetical protein
MQPFSRIIVVLLLMAFAASTAGAQAIMLPAGQSSFPAGCHGHALPTPPHIPLSHQCCIAGHNHAIPASLFSGLRLLPHFGRVNGAEPAEPAFAVDRTFATLIFFSSVSPGLIALRI